MAEPTNEAEEKRLERLERQMESVLNSLERLNLRLGVSPEPSTPAVHFAEPVQQPPPVPKAPPIKDPGISWRSGPPPIAFDAPQPSKAQPPQAHPSAPTEAVPPRKAVDWEDVVGRQWALWVGAIAVFLAVAFFLAYAWHSLTDGQRLAVGGCAGFAFLFGAEFARKRTVKGFSEGLAGGGLAILYLDAWAACSNYRLASFEVALGLMVAVSVLGVCLALRYDSTSLHGLATIGGFATPALLQAPGGQAVSPFLWYITVLNAGVLTVSVAKGWRLNSALSALATIALFMGWSDSAPILRNEWLVFAFVSLNYLMYLAAALYPAGIQRRKSESTDYMLLLGATAAYFAAGDSLTLGLLGTFNGAFAMSLGALLGAAAIWVRMQCPEDNAMKAVCIGAACSLGAIAVPIQLRQGWVCVGWCAEAAVLLTVAGMSGSVIVRRAGQVIWALSALALVFVIAATSISTERLFLNEHGIPVIAFALAAFWLARFRPVRRYDDAAPAYSAAVVLASGWLVGEQAWFGFHAGIYSLAASWAGGEMYLVSMALALFAVAVYALNASLKDGEGRAAALVVSTSAIALVLGLANDSGVGAWKPIVNPRFLAFTVNTLSLGALAWIAGSKSEDLTATENSVSRALAPVVHLLIMVSLSIEIAAFHAMGKNPLWSQQAWMAVASFLSCYAAVLLLPVFSPERAEIRWLAFLAAVFGFVMLLTSSMATWDTTPLPIANGRFLEFTFAAVSLAVIASLARKLCLNEESSLPSAAAAAAATVALWAVTQETWATCAYFHTALGANWERWAQSAVSVVWTVAASGILLYGIARGQRLTRIAALGLFGVTVGKVFLFDLNFLENQYRVLSLGGLGVALIGISWLYSRYGKGEGTVLPGTDAFAGHK